MLVDWDVPSTCGWDVVDGRWEGPPPDWEVEEERWETLTDWEVAEDRWETAPDDPLPTDAGAVVGNAALLNPKSRLGGGRGPVGGTGAAAAVGPDRDGGSSLAPAPMAPRDASGASCPGGGGAGAAASSEMGLGFSAGGVPLGVIKGELEKGVMLPLMPKGSKSSCSMAPAMGAGGCWGGVDARDDPAEVGAARDARGLSGVLPCRELCAWELAPGLKVAVVALLLLLLLGAAVSVRAPGSRVHKFSLLPFFTQTRGINT